MVVCYAMPGTTITCHVTLVFSIVMATPLSSEDVALHHKYPASPHPANNTAQQRNQILPTFLISLQGPLSCLAGIFLYDRYLNCLQLWRSPYQPRQAPWRKVV